jgi:hypothetical protein
MTNMTEETKPEDAAVIDISDEQIDKYIESRGEVDLEKSETDEEPKKETEEPKAEVDVQEEPKREKPEKPPEGFVKHEALHEERMRRKEMQQKIQVMEQRFQEIVNNLTPRAEQPKPPSPEEDPIGHLRYQQDALNRSVEDHHRFLAQQQVNAQQQAMFQSTVNTYAAKAAEYSKTNESFNDAYKYLIDSRKNEYTAVGYQPEEISRLLQDDELAIVNKAFQDEANPAERIYNIAVARGFSSKKQAPGQQKIEAIDKGVKASRTLANVSGGTSKGLSLETIAEMSDEEFDKIDYSEIRRLGLAGE